MKASPISEYGLIGNTRTSALISRHGSVDWCCFPRFDSPSFFARILDEKNGGFFSISPVLPYRSHQRYITDTNVLQTVFEVEQGTLVITDFFPASFPLQELHPSHEMVRIIEAHGNALEIEVTFRPGPGYGRILKRLTSHPTLGLRVNLNHESLFLNSKPRSVWNLDDPYAAKTRLIIDPATKVSFSMVFSREAPAVLPCPETAEDKLRRTIDYWHEWISRCNYHGPYQADVRRSILALKLLFYSPSGALLAAPTTSLPESPGGGRNWDYRYCWLRDATLALRAFLDLGYQEEAKAFMNWILHSTALTRPYLQVVYDVYGKSKIAEKILGWWEGYEQSRPVRIGNGAHSQFQLDVYGEVMQALYLSRSSFDQLDSDTQKFMVDIADAVCDLWAEPDEGIWEIRSGRKQHTHSKVMSWVALDRLITMVQDFALPVDPAKYVACRDQIKTMIDGPGFNRELNSYVCALDSDQLDASLLLLPVFDYEFPDPSFLSGTIEAIRRDLSQNQLVFRYKNVSDGFTDREGAFAACSFWMVEAMVKAGMKSEAKSLMDSMLGLRNSLGLWPEEISTEGTVFLGNYPQAFTHTALIGAALSMEGET